MWEQELCTSSHKKKAQIAHHLHPGDAERREHHGNWFWRESTLVASKWIIYERAQQGRFGFILYIKTKKLNFEFVNEILQRIGT